MLRATFGSYILVSSRLWGDGWLFLDRAMDVPACQDVLAGERKGQGLIERQSSILITVGFWPFVPDVCGVEGCGLLADG